MRYKQEINKLQSTNQVIVNLIRGNMQLITKMTTSVETVTRTLRRHQTRITKLERVRDIDTEIFKAHVRSTDLELGTLELHEAQIKATNKRILRVVDRVHELEEIITQAQDGGRI